MWFLNKKLSNSAPLKIMTDFLVCDVIMNGTSVVSPARIRPSSIALYAETKQEIQNYMATWLKNLLSLLD